MEACVLVLRRFAMCVRACVCAMICPLNGLSSTALSHGQQAAQSEQMLRFIEITISSTNVLLLTQQLGSSCANAVTH